MTDYRDRQLELFLLEELGGEVPPNQVQSILQTAQRRIDRDANKDALGVANCENRLGGVASADCFGLNSVAGDTPQSCSRPISYPTISNVRAIVSSAMGIVAVVLIVVGIVWFENDSDDGGSKISVNGSNPLSPVVLVERDGVVMPAITDADFRSNEPRLRDGWVMIQQDFERLLVGFDELELNKARAVVRVGHVPDSYEVAFLARQLQLSNYLKSNEEFEMIINSRRWVAMMGFAVCMLSGEAVVGQETLAVKNDDADITVDQVFDRFDLNDDNELQMDECVCACAKKCDLNSDETVTRQEFHKAVEKFAGSERRYVQMVSQHGGVEAFYAAAKSGRFAKVAEVSMDSVFEFLDKDKSGVLEKKECICPGSKMADADKDDRVTQQELSDVAVGYFGSEEDFLAFVREKGGVEKFYSKVLQKEKRNKTTIGKVFNQFDRDMSGELEDAEMIFPNAKKADANNNGKISMSEMKRLAKNAFGSVKKFEAHVDEYGGAEKFYDAVAAGKIGPAKKTQ